MKNYVYKLYISNFFTWFEIDFCPSFFLKEILIKSPFKIIKKTGICYYFIYTFMEIDFRKTHFLFSITENKKVSAYRSPRKYFLRESILCVCVFDRSNETAGTRSGFTNMPLGARDSHYRRCNEWDDRFWKRWCSWRNEDFPRWLISIRATWWFRTALQDWPVWRIVF